MQGVLKLIAKYNKHKVFKDKFMFAALLVTIPSVLLWLLATLSFVYVSVLGPLIFSLPPFGEVLLFLGLPLVGMVAGFISYRKNKSRLAYYVAIANTLLFAFVLFASALVV